MEETLETLIAKALEILNNNEGNDENAMKEINKMLGLSEEGIKKAEEAHKCIDKFAEKLTDLENAKAEGSTREEWIADQIEDMTDGMDEESKTKILNAVDKNLDNSIVEVTPKEE